MTIISLAIIIFYEKLTRLLSAFQIEYKFDCVIQNGDGENEIQGRWLGEFPQ